LFFIIRTFFCFSISFSLFSFTWIQAMFLIRTDFSEVPIFSCFEPSVFGEKNIFLHFWVQKCVLHRMMQKSANYLE
jgi:hypothetical protein